MNGLDSVLGWLAIGAAAGLAALMWPFLRGRTGALIKLLVGPAGAVVGAAGSRIIFPPEPAIACLVFAAVGAIASLLMLHVVWHRYARSKTSAA